MSDQDQRLSALEQSYDVMRDALICIFADGDRHASWTAQKALDKARKTMSRTK